MNRHFKKRLIEYIEQKKRQKVPSKIIKGLFLKRGYSQTQVSRIFLEYYLRRFFGLGISLVLAMGLFGMLFLYTNTKDTTRAQEGSTMIEEIDQAFEISQRFNWTPNNQEAIDSLKVSGHIDRAGLARIVLVASEYEYVLFDSSALPEEFGSLGANVSVSAANDSMIVPILTIDRTIAPANEPILLSVSSKIDGNISQDKICTIWTIEESVCYGSPDCCAFVEAPHEDKPWNESLYLTIGKYGAGISGNASVQIAYVDFNVSGEDPYSNTIITDSIRVPFQFYEKERHFDDACVETCSLPDLEDDSYILSIETNGSLYIDYLLYTMNLEGPNAAPFASMNFSNISLEQDSSISYNLSLYFSDPENDTLEFSYFNGSNLQVIIGNGTAILRANETNESFLGTEFMYFVASDSEFSTASNVFSITVVEKQPKPFQIIEEGLKSLRGLIGI